MFERLKRWLSPRRARAPLDETFAQLKGRLPAPVCWLFGKTQSGKTSIIRYLTGADDAEIGQGFRPCTRFSREYQFPSPQTPLVTFLDTRGLDEPGYDPAEDLAQFGDRAHVVIVTVKALDHGQANVLEHLRVIRRARPERPVLLALTNLHEAHPQDQHPEPYPYGTDREATAVPEDLRRSLAEQEQRFAGLFDRRVALDLTRPEEGYVDPAYGGPALKDAIIEALPAAYRQTLLTLEDALDELQDAYARHALPRIVAYSSLAASAGAIPIPWLDLLVLPGIQTRMIHDLAGFYGQPLSAARFLELAGTLGLGIALRQAAREVVKFIPYVGSVAGGVLAGASTFALGKAFCYYFSAVHRGHVPGPDEVKHYYHAQLTLAEGFFRREKKKVG